MTVRHLVDIVRQVLQYALDGGMIATNPAEKGRMKLPKQRTLKPVVDDPEQFLTPAEVADLVDATPWPYSVTVHCGGVFGSACRGAGWPSRW